MGYLDNRFIPVQENAIKAWSGIDSEEVIKELKSSLQEINSAFFVTDAERVLYQSFDQIIFSTESSITDPHKALQMLSEKQEHNMICK